MFAGDSTYEKISSDELEALDAIPAVLVDRNWFMIFDNFYNFTEQYNGEGLYWNYWYHVWKTFSVSPFANNALFIPGTPDVTSVTVSPGRATVVAGQSVQLSANVVTTNFAPKSVTWTVDSEHATVDNSGKVTVLSTAPASTNITVTATSTYGTGKKGTATVSTTAA